VLIFSKELISLLHRREKLKSIANFLKRKDIIFTKQRYLYDSMSYMAFGLFASLIIGLIIRTMGEQLYSVSPGAISTFLVQTGSTAMSVMGAAIGVAVAYALKAPPLVIFSSAVTGTLGAALGGPAGAYCAGCIGAEFGKAINKETKLDILLTPAITIILGGIAAASLGRLLDYLMRGLGQIVMHATELQPFLMGIVVAVVIGVVLTTPIFSSTALCIMMNISGLAAGAATVGGCCHMIGFAVISFKDNRIGGFFAHGLGTSMIQIPNIMKNWKILLPSILASAVLGPLSTTVFKMTNLPHGSGLGTSGLVGQITTFIDMGFSAQILVYVLLLHFILPALISWIFYLYMRQKGHIKDGDMLLDF
jgi:hypothetical protein